MRAHLARLLVMEPDLLLLDEPTNHLDLESLLWLQEYLKGYPGAILMISHDRAFLNELVGNIVEIRFTKLVKYRGNYDAYLVQREQADIQHQAAYENQQREIARMKEFVDRFRAKATKASQAQSKLKAIERMDLIEAPLTDGKALDFRFPQPERSGLKVVELKDIHQAYGSNVVYAGMNFSAERGQRIVLVGPNGAGKSTLLKLLADVIQPQGGTRTLGHNVRHGYFSQYRGDILNMERTILEEALDTPQRVTEQFVRSVLGCFLFRDDDVFKKISVLSGGEKSRVALVKLLLNPPNLLLMDEPTTHLDMASIDALVQALKQFEGTIIFISHDVYFIRELANHVIRVQDGELRHYPGPYQYYVDKTGATPNSPASTSSAPATRPESKPAAGVNRKEQKRLEALERQAKSKDRQALRKKVTDLEARIAKLEARHAELVALLEDPASYEKDGKAALYNREISEIAPQLEALNLDWANEAEKLAELGG
jgi:ATP-binding cassette subfamily F protein 3